MKIWDKKELPFWLLCILSWLFALYFLSGLFANLELPPSVKNVKDNSYLLFLTIAFVFAPFFHKIKIGKLFEIEREIQETKSEVKDFKNEVRNSFTILSTSIVAKQSTNVTFNMPDINELIAAREKIDESESSAPIEETRKIQEQLLEDEDTMMALARIRMQIEYLLYKYFTTVSEEDIKTDKYRPFSLQRMFKQFIEINPNYRDYERPFSYVINVCNAAIHAQVVSSGQANEAIDIGARIIAMLKNVVKERP